MKNIGFWKPIVISLVVTPIALFVGLASAGAGHGNYFLTKVLFPYTMLSTVWFESILEPFFLVAIFQFPVYGIILALGRKRFGVWSSVLIAAHVTTVVLCLLLVSGNYS